MLDLLAETPVLALFLVVALGSALGLVPFGPIKLGSAGALFVGLALGAADARLGEDVGLVRTIGLAVFVYVVGVASGPLLVRSFRSQVPVLIGSAVSLLVLTVAALVGRLLDLGAGHLAGAYAGALTSTPALAAATQATGGSADPAVGYSLAYPFGVIFGILTIHVTMRRTRSTPRDPVSAAAQGLVDITVAVERTTRLADVPAARSGALRFSYWWHDDVLEVAGPGCVVQPGDRLVVIGTEQAVTTAVEHLGSRAEEHLAHDRRAVDYRRVLLSNPGLAGRSIADLDIPGRFGGAVTRVRRGDVDLLAADELHVQLGDRLRVVVPRGRMPEVTRFLGDVERRVSEVDAVSLGLGLTLGILVGLVSIPLGPGTLSLGAAAGPLVVGVFLGWRERTGPLVWTLPSAAGTTLRQFGLLLFMAAVGLSSGPALAAAVTEPTGRKLLLVGALLAATGPALMATVVTALGMSPARSGGLIAGFLGNPGVLAFAASRADDERVTEGYATVFPVDLVLKVLLVQVIVGLAGGT